MPRTASDITPMLQALRRALGALYGHRLDRLVLYGSYARGEATEDSDVDVVVVLKGPVDTWEELDRMAAPAYRVELDFGKLLTLYPVSRERFRSAETPLFLNVRREGIEL